MITASGRIRPTAAFTAAPSSALAMTGSAPFSFNAGAESCDWVSANTHAGSLSGDEPAADRSHRSHRRSELSSLSPQFDQFAGPPRDHLSYTVGSAPSSGMT